MLETLDYTIRIGSIPTFLYFDLYLYSAYAANYFTLFILTPHRFTLTPDDFTGQMETPDPSVTQTNCVTRPRQGGMGRW